MISYTIKDIYDNIDFIQPGDTLMVHRKGNLFTAPSAWIIRTGTNGPFNHAAMITKVDKTNKKIMIVEADTKKGVCEVEIDKYDRKDMLVLIMRPLKDKEGKTYTKAMGQKAVEEIRKFKGLKYDFFGVFGFTFEALGNAIIKTIFRKWNPAQWRNKFFCSELVVTAYRNANIAVCEGITPGSASPNDIFRDALNGMKIILFEKNDEIIKMYKNNLRQEILDIIKKEK